MNAADLLGEMHRVGLLTTDELTKVATNHEAIRPELERQVKIANFMKDHPIAGAAVTAGVATGAAALAGMLADAAGKGISSLKDSVTKARDYKEMLSANPQLKDYDQKKVHRAYYVMRKLMPDLASDPVISGEWVKQLAMREAYGTDTLKSMMDAQGAYSKNQPYADSGLAAAMTAGVGAGASEAGQMFTNKQMRRGGWAPPARPERTPAPGQGQGGGHWDGPLGP